MDSIERDIVALNRHFLLVAREATKLRSGEMLTGLPRAVLDLLAEMSVGEIEEIAKEMKLCVFTMRLTAEDLENIREIKKDLRASYVITRICKGDKVKNGAA